MSFNFLILLLYFFIIITSVIGYGLILDKFIGKKKISQNLGYLGFLGLFFLTLYSYVSHLLFAHSQIHNSFIIIIGIIFFLLNFKKKNRKKKELIILLSIFILLFSGLLIIKNHDDFSYYHFPYTYYLTQHNLSFGIGQFGHGFRTQSSVFYLNSLFYLPFAKYHLFNIYYILVIGFANIILINRAVTDLPNSLNKVSKVNYIKYLSLISFVFVNIFFYRISEHGTDRSAQILIIVLIIELLNLNYHKKFELINLGNIYLISALIISIKAFFILYIIFVIPIIYLITTYKYDFKNTVKIILLNKFSFLFLLILFFTLFTNFSNTGCLIYPISFTCITSVSWGISIEEVNLMNNWYELWSKAGAGPNFRVENPNDYINGFSWVSHWIQEYFFNKISDFLLGLFVLLLIISLVFNLNNFSYQNLKINKYIYITYGIIVFLFLEWFYNHPALRYGGYCIIFMLFFIPVSLFLSTVKLDIKKYFRNSVILLLLSVLIFNARNINRISSEIEKYSYKPFTKTFYQVNKNDFRIENRMNKLIKSYNDCKTVNIDCEISEGKIKVLFGKYIFINQ